MRRFLPPKKNFRPKKFKTIRWKWWEACLTHLSIPAEAKHYLEDNILKYKVLIIVRNGQLYILEIGWLYNIFTLRFRVFECIKIILKGTAVRLHVYGWNCPGRIFFQKIVTFFATLTPVFKHFLHWFYCFYYFYGSITCAGVGKTKFLTRHLRLGTWKNPLNMDDFQVFSHFFPFCISICML